MGLLDYYRQFEDLDQEEVNRGLREKRARERALALEHVAALDLSSTEWPDFPNSEVVNASIAAARGRVNGYPDRHASPLRSLLAKRHGVAPEQIVVGNGAAELLQAAALALLGPGDELATLWPSYPLYPLMASRAGARPVPSLDSIGERTRVVVLCNPNDPTGTYMPSQQVAELASSLPEHTHLLVDEAYIQFQDVEDEDACVKLIDAFPRLLVFRTFSKIYGLSGLRCGYVLGSPSAASLLESLAPVLGVNVLTQAAMMKALSSGAAEIDRRRRLVIEQRGRILSALHDLPVNAAESQANFLWLESPGLSGAELAARLEKSGVIVAPGGPLGEDHHVRVSIRGAAASERLLNALEQSLVPSP